jgi:iron complex outermembrane receptor protein
VLLSNSSHESRLNFMLLKHHPLAVAIALSVFPASVFATDAVADVVSHQQATAGAPVTAQSVNTLPTIVVTAHPLNRSASDLTTPVNVLDREALMSGGTTLGSALDGQVGVHVDTFGGGASRPVIRGQTAPRVKVLSDGSEVMDASTISPDHAVTVEPLLAEKIEVLRGPATLLYGGGAIGGVVNVLDNKIPSKMPENGVEGEVNLRANTAANEKAGAAALTVGLGDQFALHVEGSKRDANNYIYRGGEERRVDGTFAEGETGSVGFSWIGDKGFAGLSFTQRKDKYGLPGHSHEYEACHIDGLHLHCEERGHEEEEEHAHEEEEHGHDEHEHGHEHEHAAVPWVELDSKRVDFRAEYDQPFKGFDKIKVRAGYTDYQHDEIEEGTVATSFKNKGYDGRIELTHVPVAGLQGVIGVQYSHSDFQADGEEAFLPKTITENISAFFLEHYQWNDVHFELGGRHEWQTIKPTSDVAKFNLKEYDDSASSVSAGATWEFIPDYALALSLSHSERLPNAQELYANGGHFATNTYELGDTDLDKEKSNNVELNLRKTAGDATFALSVYHNQVDNYIYAKTLDKFEDFRLIQYTQNDATFTGAEAEMSYQFDDVYKGTVFGDYVRAKLDNAGGNLPRIPAARAGGRIQAKWDAISGGLEYYHVFDQKDIADFEKQTSGYDIVNLNVGYNGMIKDRTDYRVYLQINNLLDETYYNHSSFLSSIPQVGRNFGAGVQFKF